MGTLAIPTIGQKGNTEHPKVNAAIEAVNAFTNSSNVPSKPVAWYTPKAVATEELRTSSTFGTLTTKDEVENVVLNEGAVLLVNYRALWKASVSGDALAAIFLNSNQLKVNGLTSTSTAPTGTAFNRLGTVPWGLRTMANSTAFSTTGEAMILEPSAGVFAGGFAVIFAAAGTYNVSIRFNSGSGTVTAKERLLQVLTVG
jgi:hypothetical protein